MQKKQIINLNNEERSLSVRAQKLISHLGTLWENPTQPSPEMFKRIIAFLSQLPAPDQASGMTKIAEYFASSMGLHFIDLIAKFQEKARLEDMDEEEIGVTLEDAINELFPEMMGISKQIVIGSLDDLVTASNITFGLYTLSQADTAENIQNWIYELPTLYLRYLSQEHLMANLHITFIVVAYPVIPTKKASSLPSWNSYPTNPVTLSIAEQKRRATE